MIALAFHRTRFVSKVSKFVYCFHTSQWNCGQAQVMRKLLKGTAKKKHIYNEAPMFPTPETFSKGVFEGKRSVNSKRAAVLNKLFMRHITDLMATGENASVYAGLGIEISKVVVTPDFKVIHVYWICKDFRQDNMVQKLLTKNAGLLRHQLTQLRVIGIVPKLLFLKDKTLATLAKIDSELAIADFGDDHVPMDVVSKLKMQLEINTPLEPAVKEKIQSLDAESVDDVLECTIPTMPHTVYGLNHAEVMSRIIKGIQKAKGDHRSENCTPTSLSTGSTNNNPVQYADGMSQKDALQKFLLQRRLLKSKAMKEYKNYLVDKEVMLQQFEESQQQMLLGDENAEEEDYIDEVDDEHKN